MGADRWQLPIALSTISHCLGRQREAAITAVFSLGAVMPSRIGRGHPKHGRAARKTTGLRPAQGPTSSSRKVGNLKVLATAIPAIGRHLLAAIRPRHLICRHLARAVPTLSGPSAQRRQKRLSVAARRGRIAIAVGPISPHYWHRRHPIRGQQGRRVVIPSATY